MEQLIPLDETVEATLPKEIRLIRSFLREEEKEQVKESEKNETDTKTNN